MRADALDVRLRDGGHSQLVCGTGEERSERGEERNRTCSTAQTDAHTDQVLFGDVALNETVWELLHVGLGVSGVLRVSVQSDHTAVHFAELNQRSTVSETGSDFVGGRIRWWFAQLDRLQIHDRCVRFGLFERRVQAA